MLKRGLNRGARTAWGARGQALETMAGFVSGQGVARKYSTLITKGP